MGGLENLPRVLLPLSRRADRAGFRAAPWTRAHPPDEKTRPRCRFSLLRFQGEERSPELRNTRDAKRRLSRGLAPWRAHSPGEAGEVEGKRES